MIQSEDTPLTVKELAREYLCSRGYIWAAQEAGFVMAGRKASLREFRDWIRNNPGFRCTPFCKKKSAVEPG